MRSLSKALPLVPPAPQHTLHSLLIPLLTCHSWLPKSKAPYAILLVSATTSCVILNTPTHMHRKTQTLAHTPTFNEHPHIHTHTTHTLQRQFPCCSQRQRQSAIPLSKRLSDDESERFLRLIFDVQRGCDQRGLTLPLSLVSPSLFFSFLALCSLFYPPLLYRETLTLDKSKQFPAAC